MMKIGDKVRNPKTGDKGTVIEVVPVMVNMSDGTIQQKKLLKVNCPRFVMLSDIDNWTKDDNLT